jgi:signal transduction histidine kinase/ActR/RegA family two-component response regulator
VGRISFKFTALERRVFLVALVSLLPLVLLSCVLLVASARAQRENLLRTSEDTMGALMGAVDTEIKSALAALDVLAASPRLARGDFTALREEAVELLKRRAGWQNVVIADTDHQLLNARVTPGDPLPAIRFGPLMEEVLRSRRPIAGEIHYSELLGEYTAVVMVPLVRGDRRLVIEAVIRPDHFLGLLDPINAQKSSPDGVVTILDRNGVVVARSLNQKGRVGQPASTSLLDVLNQGRDRGITLTTTLEGVPAYTVYRRSPYSRWIAAIGIPRHTVDGPVQRSYVMLSISVLASVLAGLIAATRVGRTIVTPMRELEESAAQVGRGEPPRTPATRLAEVRRVAAALGRAHDERAAAFQREHEARVAAEQASKAKDEFLAMLGHELRNPLAAITNASRLLEHDRAALTAGAAAASGIITRQARHLARLTDDLLDAGRVILGKIQLTRMPVDLATALHGCLEGLRASGRLADHKVDADLQPAWVDADPTRIDQVIGNLLTNAVKYTPRGGRIDVATRREGTMAVLEVSDTGIGLEPELLTRAFDLFVQGDRALDRSQGGLGVGLTLVRRLAELHGGTAMASSAGTSRGATFTVRLPAIDAPASRTDPAQQTAAVSAHHVALVEDNEDSRESLKLLLELEGHHVHAAADGPTGADLVANDPRIDVAFIDIGLPGLDGYGVARAIRSRRSAGIRLVAMSGYGAHRDIDAGMQAGFDAYIVKPADLDAIRAELDRAPASRQSNVKV